MCGIAGIYHYGAPSRTADEALLRRMAARLEHRGPDDEGFFIDGPLGLAHRRLSIVDTSPTGHQPMVAEDGSAISYNGEAYNHAKFRARLEAKGVRFRGTSDTETLLHLLRLQGPRALEDVAGIFGLAFWDARHRRLILARDPLGVKQIYFHDDGERIVFASEIKAVLECAGVPRAIDPQGINEYLHFHTPLFEHTFFKDIVQVRAGEYLEITRAGARPHSYWHIDGFADGSPVDPAAKVAELETLLREVVAEQLMSDVPVGAFFSGGIDSTAVTAFAKDAGHRLRCFGVHFSNTGVIDERPYQEMAAAALGVDLDLTTVEAGGFPDDLARLMYFQDQPVVGPALIPMFHVSKLAARHVKVCLGGQGADEVFGGYARHALAHPTRVMTSWFKGRAGRPGPTQASGGAPASRGARVGGNLMKQLADVRNVRRLLARLPHWADWRTRYFDHFAKVPASTWTELLAPELFSRARAMETFRAGVDGSPATDPLDKVFHWESRTYLTALFQQDDRMSMANSLESRVPLADPRVVRFALRVPPELKLRGGATKWVLRQAVAERIPEVVLNRRKVGFDTPVEAWLRGPHNALLHDVLLSTAARGRGFYDARAVERLLADPGRPYWFDLVWKLLSIETWAQTFLDGTMPDPPRLEPRRVQLA